MTRSIPLKRFAIAPGAGGGPILPRAQRLVRNRIPGARGTETILDSRENSASDCMLLVVTTWNEFRRGNGTRIAIVLRRGILLFFETTVLAALGQAQSNTTPASAALPVAITLDNAIRLAQASEPGYAAAKGTSQSAALDPGCAHAVMLPSARLYNQDIYTQPNGLYAQGGEGVSTPNPKFVAVSPSRLRLWQHV